MQDLRLENTLKLFVASELTNRLFLPKTTVYGRKNILRVFAQLTNVTFQLI